MVGWMVGGRLGTIEILSVVSLPNDPHGMFGGSGTVVEVIAENDEIGLKLFTVSVHT